MKVELMTPGLHELENKLRMIGVAAATEITDRALTAGGQIVLSAIRSRAPVGKTGRLKGGLTIGKARKYKYGGRTVSVGYISGGGEVGTKGMTLLDILAAKTKGFSQFQKGSMATKTKAGLRFFYPAAVEFGHAAPYATQKRVESGQGLLRKSRSTSILLTSSDKAGMSEAMRNYRAKLASAGAKMDAAHAAGKTVKAKSFMRTGFDASVSSASDTINKTLRDGIAAIWTVPASAGRAG